MADWRDDLELSPSRDDHRAVALAITLKKEGHMRILGWSMRICIHPEARFLRRGTGSSVVLDWYFSCPRLR